MGEVTDPHGGGGGQMGVSLNHTILTWKLEFRLFSGLKIADAIVLYSLYEVLYSHLAKMCVKATLPVEKENDSSSMEVPKHSNINNLTIHTKGVEKLLTNLK